MVDALETLDEFEDSDYTAYQEYQAFVTSYEGTYETLYLNRDHKDFSAWKMYAETDGFKVKSTEGDTKLC